MKFEVFESLIMAIQSQNEKSAKLGELGIDMYDYETGYVAIMTVLFRVYYSKAGEDWISWYLYDRDNQRTGQPNKAYDKDKNEICFDVKSLWKHVEEIRVSNDFEEYEMPKQPELSNKQLQDFFAAIFRGPDTKS